MNEQKKKSNNNNDDWIKVEKNAAVELGRASAVTSVTGGALLSLPRRGQNVPTAADGSDGSTTTMTSLDSVFFLTNIFVIFSFMSPQRRAHNVSDFITIINSTHRVELILWKPHGETPSPPPGWWRPLLYAFKSVPGDKIKGEGKIEGGERFGQKLVSVFTWQ